MTRNVAIDGSFLTRRYFGCGANRYFINLLRHMERQIAESDGVKFRVLLPSKRDATGQGIGQQNGFELVTCPAMRLRKLWRFGLWQYLPSIRMKSDAVFLPFPAPMYFKSLRLAVTVHDIIPLVFPDRFRTLRGRIMQYSYLSSLRRADLVFTDSNYSKMDMVSRCGVPAGRIVVAHLGFDSGLFSPAPVDPIESRRILCRHGIDQPYILHVGFMEPRKNLVRLVRAYRSLLRLRKTSSFQLVLVGHIGWGFQDLLRLLEEPDLRGRVILAGTVTDDELAVLYKASAGLVMPSLYEGFGLPPLEAMASGVP
ncbi:MAG: glycosyltransferase family 4 protein, partial [Candidatus Micrarchaeaceae archaeon]